MQPESLFFKLSDVGEHVVRTYECTQLKRWFSPPTKGYLTVTNKRIVFHSSGASLTGKSLIISEMSLDDVSGLSVYYGQSINLLRIVLFSLIALVVTNVVFDWLPSFLVHPAAAILLMLPFGILWLLSNDSASPRLREKILDALDNFAQGRLKIDRDVKKYLPYARPLLFLGLIILGYLSNWLALLFILAFVILSMFGGTQRTFSLLIGSKTMKDAGIFIPGDTLNLLSLRDTTALRALEAKPAVDADQVIRDLGAMVMDIQQLGELGVQKWRA